MADEKAIKIGASLPESLVAASKNYADTVMNGNFSRVIQESVREYLEHRGALNVEQSEDELLLDQIKSLGLRDEVQELIKMHSEESLDDEH